jgi:hypothetical protein
MTFKDKKFIRSRMGLNRIPTDEEAVNYIKEILRCYKKSNIEGLTLGQREVFYYFWPDSVIVESMIYTT